MRSLDAQLQLLLFAALLYTTGSGGLRYNLGPRLAPSLQDIVNTATDSPPINTTSEPLHRPDICCWDDAPSLAPTVVLRPSHPDAVPDPTWAETLRTATWRALGEGSGRSPPWQELSVAAFPKPATRTPPPPDREVVLLARGVLIRDSDDRLRFTEECVCDANSAEAAGVLATWAVRRLRHSGPNEFHRPYFELQFSASAILPPLSRPVTVLPPAGQSAPVPKGIVFNLTGTRRTFLTPDPDQSTRLPIASVKEDRKTTTDIAVKLHVNSTEEQSSHPKLPSSTTPTLETAAAEDTRLFTTVPESSTPESLGSAHPMSVPDPTLVFESVPTELPTPPDNLTKLDLVPVFSTSPSPKTTFLSTGATSSQPTTSNTRPVSSTTSSSTSSTSLETVVFETSTTPITSRSTPPALPATKTTLTTSTEASTPPRSSSPFRVSLLTPSTLGRLLDLTTTAPTTFHPRWRPSIRKNSTVVTRTTYSVSAERKPKRP